MPVNGKSRRSYRGAPVSNTLGVTLNEAATNITLATAVAGWSTDAEPFFVVVDPGTAKEEKICVKYSSSTTLTVVDPAATSTWGASADGRGADDTDDRQHEQGAVIYPVFTALEANQANELVSKYANAGSVVYQGSGTPGTFTELAVGTAGQALKVNAGATAPEWGQLAAAGIADGAVTSAKILDGTIVAGDIADGAVTSAKILDNTIVLGDLATALQAFLVPVGTISAYAGATAPTGYLLCNGSSTTGYPTLIALVGATTPDLRGKFPMGKTASSTGSTLLGTGGSNTIAEANLPSHTHSIAHNHAAFSSDPDSPSHNHGYNVAIVGSNPLLNAADTSVAYAYATTPAVTDGPSTTHTHSIDVPPFTGDSGGGTGSGTAYFQPFVSVNYIIKHD